jgi:DNA-binding NarL/FixJ family response regulator
LFNSGGTFREVTFGYGYATRCKPVGRVVSMTANAAKIRRHEERFTSPEKKRQRRSTPNVKAQVLELHSRGAVEAAIADTLNLSDRRVREIIRAAA